MRRNQPDVYVIADDWRASPITDWTVRTHPARRVIARIKMIGCRFHMMTAAGGPAGWFEDLLEARDAAAFLPAPGALN